MYDQLSRLKIYQFPLNDLPISMSSSWWVQSNREILVKMDDIFPKIGVNMGEHKKSLKKPPQ